MEACDGCANTTNNIMEMTAFYKSLELLGKGKNKIYTDSKYVMNEVGSNIVNGRITGWLVGQRRRGWVGGSGKPIQNLKLWKEIVSYIELNKLTFIVEWVKGHSDNLGNERADQLANRGRENYVES